MDCFLLFNVNGMDYGLFTRSTRVRYSQHWNGRKEDANELVDELVKAREQIRMRDELIESLRNQLKATQLKKDETVQFKNNTLQENKSSNILY
ncbi:hypothetical protein CRE_14912 [Caenorhabditis remanei]|uniref:Uncharacterized protein n=1 Tax=Caenorhabditis remanei TaxID=31234 RepID=E3N7Q0_CAERE|nr:hypothetical protein CRE_14912 [Caenorhabditis remanei]